MLYIVSTPIGNLSDISIRALETLKTVDLILCEDTRVTSILLKSFNIQNQTECFNSKSSKTKIEKIIEQLKEGKKIALVCDAGTPGISDPGYMLVSQIRKLLPDLKIIPIPGASAFLATLSVSGFPISNFTFYGFIPHKKGRNKILEEICRSERTAIFYESSHRILKTLNQLSVLLKDSNKKIFIGREITKIYEEFFYGNANDALEYFISSPQKQRGEFVVALSP